MAKHNYSQYSNKKNDNKVDVTPEVTVEIQNREVEASVETTVETTIENTSITDTEVAVSSVENKTCTEINSGALTTGVVANCVKLNVRSKPAINGDVITVLNAGDMVTIDVDESTKEWFKIRTVDGVKGYCMRKFVSANI